MSRLVEKMPREWFSLLVPSVKARACEQVADASFLASINCQIGDERQNKEQSNHYEVSKSD